MSEKEKTNDNIQCLFKLDFKHLKKLVENTLNIKNWYIREDKITNRTIAICNTERFQYLKKQAQKMNIPFDNTEIVTWLDSLTMLYYTFNYLENEQLRDSIKIIQEYCIPYQNKRADYLLIHDNKILIIEFSFNQLGYKQQYETKLSQVIGYKELLSNLLPPNIEIGTHTFLVEPEEDKQGNLLMIENTDLLSNHFKVDALANLIETFFTKNTDVAINALKQL